MQVQFSKQEVKILHIWADSIIHGGHWGDGDIIFPDEQIALNTLERAANNEKIDLSGRTVQIFLIWAARSTDTPEEELLKEKLHRLATEIKAHGDEE